MRNKVILIIICLILSAVFTGTGMGFTREGIGFPVFAADSGDTEIGYGMKPLKDKLAAMTIGDIEKNAGRFGDMGSHWSRIPVGKLSGLGIISGTAEGDFLPESTLKTDQFIKMLVAAMGFKPGTGKPYWAQTYIDVARQYALTGNDGLNNFAEPISRERMAKILVRAILLVEAAPDSKYDQYIAGKIFDYPSISDDCKQSVIDAYNFGLVTGSNGKFSPKATMTRAEAAAVIIRFLDNNARKPLRPGPDEILTISDNTGKLIEMYPGAVREYFDVAKAMQTAIPKAKGFVDFGFNTEDGRVFAGLYKDEPSYKENILNVVGGWAITPETSDNADNPYASVYLLTIYNDELYKNLFSDYSHEIIKAIFGKETAKAIALHDKYMDLRNNSLIRIWEETMLNTRRTGVFRDGQGFSFFSSILNKK